MAYYFSKIVNSGFDETLEIITQKLKEEGFGILTEIDMQTTLKNKLDVAIKKYKILGACNPTLAYQALQAEKHIGLMLPCNLIVKENEDGKIEVAAIDPVASTMAIDNKNLSKILNEVRNKLKRAIETL